MTHNRVRDLKLAAASVSMVSVILLCTIASQAAHAAESELLSFVIKKAATISTMHTKAKRALANAAQDRSFATYYTAHDLDGRHAAKQRIEQVSLATQSRFHVEEMCLIDASGPEIARIVGNAIAPDSDLSPDESGNSFFKPGFAGAARHVYVAPPYISPDADKWVIAYATPIVVDGDKRAILHYEHGLEGYRDAVNEGLDGDGRYLLIVSEGGYVISDSRTDIDLKKHGDKEEAADYFQNIRDISPHGLAKVYQNIGENRTGATAVSEDGVEYGVAFAIVEGGLTMFAVERR